VPFVRCCHLCVCRLNAEVVFGVQRFGLFHRVRAAWPGGGMVQRKHLLVVDDSDTNRSLEKLLLESEGYQVTTAASGDEAWAWLQEHTADAVITDLDMPGMNGFALTDAIRASARLGALPVIVMSGMDHEQERTQAMQHGANAYLGKGGIDVDRLIEVIRGLVCDAAQKPDDVKK
jgi:CheY-like chemotaxis protein